MSDEIHDVFDLNHDGHLNMGESFLKYENVTGGGGDSGGAGGSGDGCLSFLASGCSGYLFMMCLVGVGMIVSAFFVYYLIMEHPADVILSFAVWEAVYIGIYIWKDRAGFSVGLSLLAYIGASIYLVAMLNETEDFDFAAVMWAFLMFGMYGYCWLAEKLYDSLRKKRKDDQGGGGR